MKEKTKKKIDTLFGFLILIGILSACSVKDPRIGLSRQLGIDLMNDGTTLLHETDTIDWFGDGYILSELECNDDSVLNDIMNNERWKALPLSDNVHRFFYGDFYLPNGLSIPVIDEGYYFFYDRHDQADDRYDDSDLFGRASFNFTFAIYDTEENKLYVCKFNT